MSSIAPLEKTDTPPRVLIVDDDLALLRVLGRLLVAAGYEVRLAPDASRALADARTHEFAAVVCDINLSGTSGPELVKELRRLDPDLACVLITGMNQKSLPNLSDVGSYELLSKPIEATQLRDTVDAVVESRAVRSAEDARTGVREKQGRMERVDASLTRALSTMWMAFQPIVAMGERRVLGFEALLRTRDDELTHPGLLLDAAEKTGRVHEVGARVRELCAREFVKAPSDTLLFMNLHPRDLDDDSLYDESSDLAKMADRVVLEITERSSIHDVACATERAKRLKAIGYKLAVDDLGAGYAGLSSFAELEPDLAKLDMTLVRSIHLSPIRQRVVASMLSLCRDLGSMVVAEGVETVEERNTLSELGCDLMQGYLFAKPAPPFPQAIF